MDYPIFRSIFELQSPSYYLLLALPLVLLLASVYAFIFSPTALLAPLSSSTRKPRASTSILLVGPLASGKTSAFSKLAYGYAPQTHTSMKENEAVLKSKWISAAESTVPEKEKLVPSESSKPLHLVDIPGHSRLRTRSLAQFLPAADGVVFTIDASVGLSGKNIRDAGEHLHLVLALISLISSTSHTPPPPLLILLTKSDLLPNASAANSKTLSLLLDRAKSSLARELDRRRLATQSTSAGAKLEGLESIPSSATASSSLGLKALFGGGGGTGGTGEEGGLPTDEGEVLGNEAFGFEGPFEWAKLDSKVDWAVGSVKEGQEESLKGVWEWLEERMS